MSNMDAAAPCATLRSEHPAGRRCELRLPVRLSGSLSAITGAVPAGVEVVDLSRRGACCRLAAPPSVGEPVELRLDGLAAAAIVCWVSGTRCGLQFLQPLRASDVLIQSGKSRGSAGEHPDSIRFCSPRLLRARRIG